MHLAEGLKSTRLRGSFEAHTHYTSQVGLAEGPLPGAIPVQEAFVKCNHTTSTLYAVPPLHITGVITPTLYAVTPLKAWQGLVRPENRRTCTPPTRDSCRRSPAKLPSYSAVVHSGTLPVWEVPR